MKILIFDMKFIENASCLSARTGIEIHKDTWIPEPSKAYIIFGAESHAELLLKAQEHYNLTYMIINTIEPSKFNTDYKELLKKNIVLEENMDYFNELKEDDYVVEFYLNESFCNNVEKPVEERTCKYLINLKDKELLADIIKERNVLYLDDKYKYTPKQLTDLFEGSLIYLSTGNNDWRMINKALSLGCRVISNTTSKTMPVMYKKFVKFIDDVKLFSNEDNIPKEEYLEFMTENITFALNKYLHVIKDVLIQTEGEKKPKDVIISKGKDISGNYVEISQSNNTKN